MVSERRLDRSQRVRARGRTVWIGRGLRRSRGRRDDTGRGDGYGRSGLDRSRNGCARDGRRGETRRKGNRSDRRIGCGRRGGGQGTRPVPFSHMDPHHGCHHDRRRDRQCEGHDQIAPSNLRSQQRTDDHGRRGVRFLDWPLSEGGEVRGREGLEATTGRSRVLVDGIGLGRATVLVTRGLGRRVVDSHRVGHDVSRLQPRRGHLARRLACGSGGSGGRWQDGEHRVRVQPAVVCIRDRIAPVLSRGGGGRRVGRS